MLNHFQKVFITARILREKELLNQYRSKKLRIATISRRIDIHRMSESSPFTDWSRPSIGIKTSE